MKTNDNVTYIAEEHCFIVRKSDNEIMGEGICLGELDSIDNYEDQEYTEETYNAFYNRIGRTIREEHTRVHEEINEE